MKNIYRRFKLDNPTAKQLAHNATIDFEAQTKACLTLAEKANEEAARIATVAKSPYKQFRQGYYLHKAQQWFIQAAGIYSKNGDEINAKLANEKAKVNAPKLVEAVSFIIH